MFKKTIIYLLCIFAFKLNAQTENVSDSIQNKKSDTLQIFEKVPIFPGCGRFSTNYELSKCMSDNFKKIIKKKFDSSIADSLDLPEGRLTIKTWFKINKEGTISEIKVEAPDPAFEKEVKRVLALFPKMIPGELKGKKVNVPYYLPIYIGILGADDDDKKSSFSRKQKRKFLKEARKKIRKMN